MRIVITAGPTREYVDPVRFLSNRSTGRMGYALAAAAVAGGHTVTLISGPVALAAPDHVRLVPVVSAADMLDAVLRELPACEVLIMCAAVADWRPRTIAAHKCKKDEMPDTLLLERTADILEAVQQQRSAGQVIVGFAAETSDLLQHAHSKLVRKDLDMIVANDVSRADAGFEAETNAVLLLEREGGTTECPLQSKATIARQILARVEALHASRAADITSKQERRS